MAKDLPTFDLINTAEFNLIDEPWIIVQSGNGSTSELSLLDLFSNAHSLRRLGGELPTQEFAIFRLLLAIVHRSVEGPRDVEHWQELWEADKLPIDQIADYLQRFHDRFYLFHPATPFFQVADLRTAKDATSGLTKLIAEFPDGHPFFTTRARQGITQISYAEAARWLVHIHAFDPSGIKSGALGTSGLQNGRGYPQGTGWSGRLGGIQIEGTDLRRSLLLNTIPSDSDLLDEPDLPAWEREHSGAASEEREPTGPLDFFTWQSRRVRLYKREDSVVDALIANGDRLTPQNRLGEPMTAWRRSLPQEKKLGKSPVYMPRAHQPDVTIWRGLGALLPSLATRGAGNEAAAYLSSGNLKFMAELDGIVDESQSVRIRAYGMVYGSNESVVTDVINDQFDVHLPLLKEAEPVLGAIAESAIESCDAAAREYATLAERTAKAAGASDTADLRSHARAEMYAALDPLFRDWLSKLGSTDRHVDDVVGEWHRTANDLALAKGNQLIAQAAPGALFGRRINEDYLSAAKQENWYRINIRKAFPLAYNDIDAGGTK